MTDPISKLLGEWAGQLCAESVIFRIAVALVFAAIIGCERAAKRHAAGLRTFMLVSLASTMAAIADGFVAEKFGGTAVMISAAALIGAAIISSNTILYSSKNQIKGLTTSVAVWAVCVLGILLGAGLYTAALCGFIALLCTLSLFPGFETYLKNRSNHFEVHLELTDKAHLQDFVTTLRKLGVRIDDIEANPAYIGSGLAVFSVSMTINSPELKKYKTHKEIIEALGTLEYVYYIEEMSGGTGEQHSS